MNTKLSPGILSGMRIIEGSAFVAAPLGGLTLAQLGAEVIRFDPIGGGLDFSRWPVAENGVSLFWNGLNRGKKSIQVDIKSNEGKQLVQNLITDQSKDSGIFITNFPTSDWLSYKQLSSKREDLIMVSLVGNYDGSSEVDYTVNPAFGYPSITGPVDYKSPVNHVLPAWDLILGNLAAVAILAADRRRSKTGKGDFIQIALSDVALWVAGSLGRLSDAFLKEDVPAQDGNFLYGSFGHDFLTSDGKRIMIVGLTLRQWNAVVTSLKIQDEILHLENSLGLSLSIEGNRYSLRHELREIIKKRILQFSFDEIKSILNSGKVSWAPYQTFVDLVENDSRASEANPIYKIMFQPEIGSVPNISSPIRFTKSGNMEHQISPSLGMDTKEILRDILKLTPSEIQELVSMKIVA